MASGFRLHAAELQRGITELEPRARAALGAVMDREGTLAVAYMKTNAPWTDRTTNARNGLDSTLVRAGAGWALILFGRMPYQIFLETANSGKYAIITPTMQIWGARVMRATEGLLDRMGSRRV